MPVGETDADLLQADWRGVLAAATLKEMGLPNVLHLAGGFGEWRKANAPTGAKPEKKLQPVIPLRAIDHLVLRVRDIEAMRRFYCDVLGAPIHHPSRGNLIPSNLVSVR